MASSIKAPELKDIRRFDIDMRKRRSSRCIAAHMEAAWGGNNTRAREDVKECE